MRPRTILLLSGLLILLGIVALWVLSHISNIERQSVKTSSDYERLIARFPSALLQAVPSRIPPDAIQIRGDFQSASGLGPSSTRLTVSFVLAPNAATEILNRARVASATSPGRQLAKDSVTVSLADQLASIRANPTTGEVIITLQDN